jgi:hypothetical protein
MPDPEAPGQPAPERYQPAPESSCQSNDPAEPETLDVMVHNKPQAEKPKSRLRRDEQDAPFGRDSDEDLQGEADLARELARQPPSDRR